MSIIHNSEWERTQHYLIRSLFQDISTLTPVDEEPVSLREDPASSSSSPSKHEQARPYSPLPDLIIELEKKVNKHDEPEEFYVELERRMRKYYRKLFKGENSDSFDSITDGILNKSKKSGSVDYDDYSQNGNIASISSTSYKNDATEGSEKNTTSNTSTENSEEKQSTTHSHVHFSSSESTNVESYEVEVKAEIHTEHQELNNSSDDIEKMRTRSTNEGDSSPSSCEERLTSSISKKESDRKDFEDSERGESSTKYNEEIEVMRRQLSILPSRGSTQYDSNTSLLNKAFTAEHILGTSAIENEIADPESFSFQKSIDRCSTPRPSIVHSSYCSSNKSDMCDEDEVSGYKMEDSLLSEPNFENNDFNDSLYGPLKLTTFSSTRESSTENEKYIDNREIIRIDREIQTSPVENLINWESLKNNFFVGTPKVYNLCTCKNHHCED